MKLRHAVLLTLLALAGPQPAQAAAISTPIFALRPAYVRVMSFNACGAACRHGEIPRTARAVARAALDRRASVVLLQELCAGQYRRIRSLLGKHGYAGRFEAPARARRCGADRGFGVAIFVRGRVAGSVVVPLPTRPRYERRALLGVSTTLAGRPTFVAVVHLSPSPAAGLDEQLSALADYLGRRPGRPTLIGGDFNALPGKPALRRVAAGPYVELDAGRDEATYDVAGRKIDYVFASAESFADPRAVVTPTPMSDHRLYTGSLRVIRSNAV
jgi:endonuclease/exonuclease/phosphatase family metal-dependent hydrolase